MQGLSQKRDLQAPESNHIERDPLVGLLALGRHLLNLTLPGYGKSELNVEKKRRALSEGAERRELLTDYSGRLSRAVDAVRNSNLSF